MTRDQYYMSACMALYDKVLKSTTDLIKQVDSTCEEIEGETKDPRLLNERIMNINANAYRVLSFMITENRMLRVIASITSKIPDGSVSEDVQWAAVDMIDEKFFNSFDTGININDIKIPKIVTFEQIREPIFDLLSHMVNFCLYIIFTSLEDEFDQEKVIEHINNKIMMHMRIYDEMGLVLMSKSKTNESKPLTLKFSEEPEEADDEDAYEDDFEDEEDRIKRMMATVKEPKFLN